MIMMCKVGTYFCNNQIMDLPNKNQYVLETTLKYRICIYENSCYIETTKDIMKWSQIIIIFKSFFILSHVDSGYTVFQNHI